MAVSEGHIDIEFGGADFNKVFEADIEFFVKLCNDAGDRMTVRTVKSDDILMGLLRTLRRHGRAEGKAETLASNDGVREAQHLLKIEQRHTEKLGKDLHQARESIVRLSHAIDERNGDIVKLKDQLHEQARKVTLSPAGRKDKLQQVLKERTRQAREAGQSAKQANRRSEALEAEMSELRLRLERQQVNMASEVKLHEANRVIELMKVKLRRIHDLSNPGGN